MTTETQEAGWQPVPQHPGSTPGPYYVAGSRVDFDSGEFAFGLDTVLDGIQSLIDRRG